MTDTIEKELSEVCNVKRKSGESNQSFYKRLAIAADTLPDETWDKLSDAAGKWVNDAVKAKAAGETIANFDGEVEAERDADKSKAKPAADKASGKKADAGKGKASDKPADKKPDAKKPDAKKPDAKKPETKKVAAGSNGGEGIKVRIKKFLIKKPKSTVEDIETELNKKGEKLSRVTIAAVRSEFRHTVRVFNAERLTEIDLG